jgi:dihydroorotase
MLKILLSLFYVCHVLVLTGQTLPYSIIIKGGRVIDPKNGTDRKLDVAIGNGKVMLVQKNIDPSLAKQVVNARGLLVVPGLIDMHSHHFFGVEHDMYLRNSYYANPPDGFTFRNGITTVVDAGSSGWKSFDRFKQQTIDHSNTRVLAFLNIVGEGMRGGKYEQDTSDMDASAAAACAIRNKQYVVGFKVAHYNHRDWIPVDRAAQAGSNAGGLPVMIDFGGSGLSLEQLVMQHLRPGDIYTHMYGGGGRGREAIVDSASGTVKSFVLEARKRGIIWDVGFGAASFSYRWALPATHQGFYPDVISTDLHGGSMNSAMKDLLMVMSKFLALNMTMNNVIASVSWKPAQAIHRHELGNLSPGSVGDVTLLKVRKGKFGFYDQQGNFMKGKKKFECEVTIKDGQVFYDLNGRVKPLTKFRSGRPIS